MSHLEDFGVLTRVVVDVFKFFGVRARVYNPFETDFKHFFFEPVFYVESFIFMSKIWHIFLFCLFFLIFVNRKWDLFVLIVLTPY